MPSAYEWKLLPAGTLGHSVNPETSRRNEDRTSLSPLETAFEQARATSGNSLEQHRDLVQTYDEYQAFDEEIKDPLYPEMIAEENEVLLQERLGILADWRQYYPNQFHDNSLPLVNPATPIEVASPRNGQAAPVFLSRKMRPAGWIKSMLDRVVKGPWSSSTRSALLPLAGPFVSLEAPPRRTYELAIRERSHSLTIRRTRVSPTGSPVGRRVAALARAATFNAGSPREPIAHRTRFRIGLGTLRWNARANNPQSSK